MFANDFGSLQQMRNQRNSEQLRSYFQAIDEGRALAQQDEQANQNDNADYWKGIKEQGDAEKEQRLADYNKNNLSLNRDYFNLARDNAGIEHSLQEKKLASDTANVAKQKSNQGYAALYGEISGGRITDPVQLAHAADHFDIQPEDMAALKSYLDNVGANAKTAADAFTTQFQKSNPDTPIIPADQYDRLAYKYFVQTGEMPTESSAGVKQALDVVQGTDPRQNAPPSFWGAVTVRRPNYFSQPSEKDAQFNSTDASAIRTAVESHDQQREKAFGAFKDANIPPGERQLILPDPANLRFRPVSNYFATNGTSTVTTPAVAPRADNSSSILAEAHAAIQRGKDPAIIRQRLIKMGVSPDF